jgi:hypothetical protein
MKKNPNASGGVIERALVTRYVRRKLARATANEDAYPKSWRIFAADLLRWLETQPTRTKKAGGIGR